MKTLKLFLGAILCFYGTQAFAGVGHPDWNGDAPIFARNTPGIIKKVSILWDGEMLIHLLHGADVTARNEIKALIERHLGMNAIVTVGRDTVVANVLPGMFASLRPEQIDLLIDDLEAYHLRSVRKTKIDSPVSGPSVGDLSEAYEELRSRLKRQIKQEANARNFLTDSMIPSLLPNMMPFFNTVRTGQTMGPVYSVHGSNHGHGSFPSQTGVSAGYSGSSQTGASFSAR